VYSKIDEVQIAVEGAEIELEASVQDEAYRIAAEAVRNACIHSDRSILTIQINYGRDLIIVAGGHGKGSDVLHIHEEKPGHHGVRGMYERARNIRASLSSDAGAQHKNRIGGRLAFPE
jgi:signal transduction histidine kinase